MLWDIQNFIKSTYVGLLLKVSDTKARISNEYLFEIGGYEPLKDIKKINLTSDNLFIDKM